MKKTKKQQRIDEEKALLKERLRDILYGAHGGYSMDDPDSEDFYGVATLGIDTFGRFVGGIEHVFLTEDKKWLIDSIHLHHYDNLTEAADFLYSMGIRG